jgi:hypothetical protein
MFIAELITAVTLAFASPAEQPPDYWCTFVVVVGSDRVLVDCDPERKPKGWCTFVITPGNDQVDVECRRFWPTRKPLAE